LNGIGRGVLALLLLAPLLLGVVLGAAHASAEELAIDDIKGRIFDAHMAQQTFANGLRYCAELNGTNFYFQPRNRVLNLEDYHRGLEDLAKAQAFNPQTRRPWNEADAAQRWDEAKKQAVRDKENCALVASLPELEKRLEQMQAAQNVAPPKN
jgi:tRNA nucleotidyltransferase/poly(A) polymerase